MALFASDAVQVVIPASNTDVNGTFPVVRLTEKSAVIESPPTLFVIEVPEKFANKFAAKSCILLLPGCVYASVRAASPFVKSALVVR